MKVKSTRLLMLAVVAFAFCFTVVALDSGTSVDAEAGVEYDLNGSTLTIKANIASVEVLDLTDEQWSAVTTLVINNDVDSIAAGSLQKGTEITKITAPYALKDAMAAIFGTTDFSKATITYFEGEFKHVIIGEGVTSIAKEYRADKNLKSIVIASTVTTFNDVTTPGDNGSFSGCSNLESVTFLGDAVTKIPFYTFRNCSSLKQFDIPQNVTVIQGNAFDGCAFTDVVLPDGIVSLGGAFCNCASLKNLYVASSPVKEGVILPDGVALVSSMFKGCASIESIIVGSGSVDLHNMGSVFSGCTSLKYVELPDTITRMGGYFFENCSSLEAIKLPASLYSIREGAFSGCTSLKTIDFNGANITYYATNSTFIFKDCVSLENTIITDKGELLFAPRNASGEYTVPDGVQTILKDAYSVCDNMVSLTFTDTVQVIEANAFSNCPLLSEIHNLSQYAEIGRNAFKGTSLPDIILNDTLIYVPDEYEEYTIVESIRSIGDSVFEGNVKLKKVIFEGDMSFLTLGTNIFKNCTSLEEVVLPAGLSFIYTGMFSGCSSLKDIQLTESITYIYSSAFSGTGIESLVVPKETMTIESSAFSNCVELKTVVFEGDLTQFKSGSADSATVFAGCTSLESVTLPDNMDHIPRGMFQNCSSLTYVEWPSHITYIDRQAFQNAGLTEIIIPEGVYYLGDNAFSNCTKAEKLVLPSTIYYGTTGSANPLGATCFRAIGTDTENGVDVTICGCPNFPINLSESKKNQFQNAKIHDLIIEESPVFGKTTFTNATITGKIIVSGGSSFNLSSDLAGIKNLIQDGYLTVYVRDGEELIEGKMMSVDLMGPNVDYNKSGDILTIPADVITIPVTKLFQRLQFNGFVVEEGNPYFTVIDKALYFELNNDDPDKLENAKLVYAIMKDVNGEGISDNLVIPEGVTRMGARSTYEQSFIATSITLPSTIEVLEPHSIWNTWATIITSDQALPHFDMGAAQLGLYVKPTMPQSVIDSLSAVPDFTGKVTSVVGYVYSAGESSMALKMPLGSAVVDFSDEGAEVSFALTPTAAYDRSEFTVSANGAEVNPGDDGRYRIEKSGPVILVSTNGLRINHYYLISSESEAYSVSYSVLDNSSIEADTTVTFTITVSPGYSAEEEGPVVKLNGEANPVEFKSGRYYSTFVITDDTVIEVSGISAIDTFDVTFDSDGGSDVEGQTVVGGYTAAIPEIIPTKDGFMFFGWYLDGVLYDFGTPVTSDMVLKAMWISEDTELCTLNYEADNGIMIAVSDNTDELIYDGSKLPVGTTLTLFLIPSWGYEARSWNINGEAISTISNEMTIVVSSDTTVAVSTEYTVSSFPYLETDIMAPTKDNAGSMIWKVRGTEGFNGMVYTPSILGDYVYSVSGKQVFKISLFTGEVVKKADLVGSSTYYNFTTVGNGYVLVGFGGQVFDADLNPVFQLHFGTADDDQGKIWETKVFYNEGYYYVFTEDKVCKFLAEDLDESSNNIQYPAVTGETLYTHYISWYQGQSNLIFTDDFIIGLEYSGDRDQYRYLVTYDIDTLEVIDSCEFDEIEYANLNTGYISYYDGTVYFNTYSPNSNMFSTSNERWYSISSVELDADGRFNPATVHYYDLGTTSYPSSLVVVGDYGYINAGNFFRVIDMKTMTTVKSIVSTMSHGNMAVSVQGDKVYAYIIPYNNSVKLFIFEHDQTTNTLTDVSIVNAVDTSEYGSQIVHFGPHGEILYYNDSGYLFCIAPEYTASFVTNGGAAIPDMSFTISGAELPVAAKDGYTFLGWYDNAAFEGQAVWSIEPGTYGDQTYYAKYVVSDASMLIKSVSIDAFIDGGESVILSVEAGANSPEKVLVVTYSGYIDLPEGRILFPFLTDYVELDKDTNSAVFIPKDVDEIESLAVACYYELSGVTYSTPYAKAVTPPAYAEVELLIEEGATLTMDDLPVYGGDMLKFGYYTVDVISDEAAEYTVNGIAADGENKLYYCGQRLEVSRAAA